MDALDLRLLNDFQRDFPLLPQPFREIAARLGSDESTVLARLRQLQADGAVSRVGAVFVPRRIGASTLAALAAPAERLDEVAGTVNSFAEVNHNYEREHRFNLWFVVTAPDEARVGQVLDEIRRVTGCQVLSLPLAQEFHIDLGFDLRGGSKKIAPARSVEHDRGCALPEMERRLMGALEGGLELVPRPFSRLGMKAGLPESTVLELIERWRDAGVLKRFGIVVRHRELGFVANAMCVWDIPDEQVGEVGTRLAQVPEVTLCYRRRRAAPHWSYNLYCMIHGRARAEVEAALERLTREHGLSRFPSAVLFSHRRFKQCGARYAGRVAELACG